MKAPELLEAKKKKILAAACRLLIKRGFQDIVLDDVAKAAGVAKGTLFLYYKNKSELFSAVFTDLVDRLQERLDRVSSSGQHGQALLEQTIRTVLEHFDEYRDFFANFGSGCFPSCTPRSAEKLVKKYRLGHGSVSKILQTCRKDGLFNSNNVSYSAFALFGLCRSAMMEKAVSGAKYPLVKKTSQVLGFFIRGIKGQQ